MHNAEEYFPQELIAMFKRQQYKLFGHSAVKLCHWTKSAIYKGRPCYKQRFYGIQSHRCLQMTPSVSFCDQNCVFCWRPLTTFQKFPEKFDSPAEIIDEAVKQQRVLLSGYGEFKEQIGEKKLREASNPNNAAISLSGEPTLYPKISELIKEFHKRHFTTFLVSNGLHPEVLSKMEMPTQLYISLEAASEEMHKRVNAPLVKGSWQLLNQTLELLPSLKARKAIRITAIKGRNMSNEKEFADLIERASPDFVEVKGYMFVGYSRKRLQMGNMPLHSDVMAFAEKINKHLGYNLVDESKPSRVVLLSKKKGNLKIKPS
ncbi:MAG: 4-demethylwyosine synthase TYW1 [Candidatus Diapherotrites archaeon]|uniref:S-adenosyl-L-methionine-dependent tRNA 4-demethylwyosine synthase n=1 Tax=Candidatus Iainarchaeum sp. TaxID=3101447 RepID=A0A939C606_9ARCH|nr:4-demethylwyosine synthase TYW1 [Candidatus Diapherotrites archaeon]